MPLCYAKGAEVSLKVGFPNDRLFKNKNVAKVNDIEVWRIRERGERPTLDADKLWENNWSSSISENRALSLTLNE